MMKAFAAATVMAGLLILSGCNVEGEKTAYGQACERANDKKTIETEGFLDDGGGVFCSNTSGRMECGFDLKAKLEDEKGFSADIAVGSGANTMDELGSGYQKTDIKIRNNDGNVIDLGKKVTVTGTINSWEDKTSPEGGGCYLKVYKIEQ